MDLGRPRLGQAGQGRFIFGVVHPEDGCRRLPFTVIFEYRLPAIDACDVREWATSWRELGREPFGPRFNDKLESLTNRFAGAHAMRDRPNGSALEQLRTNERTVGPWEMRAFVLDEGGRLVSDIVEDTPDMSLAGTRELADFINVNEDSVLAGKHVLPSAWLGAAAPTPGSFIWDAPGIESSDARHAFALATCSGCHRRETDTAFTHVFTRNRGEASALSGYLTGAVVPDPLSGAPREFAELSRRAKQLEKRARLVCRDREAVADPSLEPQGNAH